MSKRRVVITGVGVISSIGNSYIEIKASLIAGRSGVESVEEWKKLDIGSTVAGTIKNIDSLEEALDLPTKKRNQLSEASRYCIIATQHAIADSGMATQVLTKNSTGCFIGNGVSSLYTVYDNTVKLYGGNIRRGDPYTIVKAMTNTCSAVVADHFKIHGRSYSIAAACATATHNIGHAFELIQSGQLDVAIAGGGEETGEQITSAFYAMRMALSTHFNDHPQTASRPYDADRDGFVISGGSGIVILEELEHAKAQGRKIYAELIGYGANSDGYNIMLPEPDGKYAAQCMAMALDSAGITPEDVDYINTHGTSTTVGDLAEARAIKRIFNNKIPYLSSTKSMTGHAISATGGQELVYCLAMLDDQFIAPSINIENLDPNFAGLPIVTSTKKSPLNVIMTNSFGFGGTNAVLVLKRYSD